MSSMSLAYSAPLDRCSLTTLAILLDGYTPILIWGRVVVSLWLLLCHQTLRNLLMRSVTSFRARSAVLRAVGSTPVPADTELAALRHRAHIRSSNRFPKKTLPSLSLLSGRYLATAAAVASPYRPSVLSPAPKARFIKAWMAATSER